MSVSSNLFNDDKQKKALPYVFDTLLKSFFILLLVRAFLRFVFQGIYALTNVEVPQFLYLISGSPHNGYYGLEVLLFSLVAIIYFWHTTSLKIKEINNMKRIYSIIIMYMSGVFFQLAWITNIAFVSHLFPYLRDISGALSSVNMPPILQEVLQLGFLNQTNSMVTLLYLLPIVAIVMILVQVIDNYMFYRDRVEEELRNLNNEFYIPKFFGTFIGDGNVKKLATFFYNYGRYHEASDIPQPDLPLGISVKNNTMYGIPGKDRNLNGMIVGPIGSGKTSAIIMNMINVDLNYYVYYLNNYYKYRDYEDCMTNEDIMGRFFNGFTIIEPSGDLAKKAYNLAKAKGIPNDVILYLNPEDKDTEGINIFNQPVDKASSMFVEVVEGISKNQDEFFKQAQRTHLEQHVFLLKLHDPNKLVGLSHLLRMYRDPNLVVNYRTQLQTRYEEEYEKKMQEHIEGNEKEPLFNQDEMAYWNIVKVTLDWFHGTYQLANQQKNQKKDIVADENYVDTEAEFVKGLRNVLNELSQSIELRRVLFDDESTFSFDEHLASGGILIVNTAKGILADRSDTLGKFILISMQNAVFRRKPGISPHHSIYIDEAPDYFNEKFISFPAQSRKYKVNVVAAMQSLDQFRKDYGDYWVGTMMNSLRHKFVFGGIDSEDATRFSKNFGIETVYERQESASGGSVLNKDLSGVEGERYQLVEKPVLSPNDIADATNFQVSVNIVSHANKQEGRLLQANFVDYDEFEAETYEGYTLKKKPYKVWKSDMEKGYFYKMIGGDLYSIGKDLDLEVYKEDQSNSDEKNVTAEESLSVEDMEAVIDLSSSNNTVEEAEEMNENESFIDLTSLNTNESSPKLIETEEIKEEQSQSSTITGEVSEDKPSQEVFSDEIVEDDVLEVDNTFDSSDIPPESYEPVIANDGFMAQHVKHNQSKDASDDSDTASTKAEREEAEALAQSKKEHDEKVKKSKELAYEKLKEQVNEKPENKVVKDDKIQNTKRKQKSNNVDPLNLKGRSSKRGMRNKKSFSSVPKGYEDVVGNKNKSVEKKEEIDMEATLNIEQSVKD